MNLNISYQHAAAYFQTTEVSAVTGTRVGGTPVLYVQCRYDFRLLATHYPQQHIQRVGYELESVAASLLFEHQELGQAEADLGGSVLISAVRTEYNGGLLTFRFEFSNEAIERLECKRAGGEVRIAVHLKVRLKELYSVPVTNPGVSTDGAVWGYCQTVHWIGQARDLIIPRSYWLERVMRGWERQTILLELPTIPLEKTERIKSAHVALTQAVQFEHNGHWAEAVAKCRLALEPLMEPEKNAEGKVVPVLKRSWETRLGKATYEWLAQTLRILKEPMNKPHHSAEHYFDRVQAKMIIAITASVVAYAAETMSEKESAASHD